MLLVSITDYFDLHEVVDEENTFSEQVWRFGQPVGGKMIRGRTYVVENEERFRKLFEKDLNKQKKEFKAKIKKLQNAIRKIEAIEIDEICEEIEW